MHVHPPKSWHGLREFLKEYGIIVLGVLTALAFEQAVEALRNRREATEARANIKDELATDLASLTERDRIEACVKRRLNEVGAAIDASQQPTYARPSWIGRPQFWPIFQAKWHAATDAGRATLLSGEEQSKYGQLYYTLELLQGAENQEQIAWAHLRALEEAPRVAPEMSAQLRLALSEARLADWQVGLYLIRSRDLARPLGLPKASPQHVGSMSVCLPMTLSRAEALARLDEGPIGEP